MSENKDNPPVTMDEVPVTMDEVNKLRYVTMSLLNDASTIMSRLMEIELQSDKQYDSCDKQYDPRIRIDVTREISRDDTPTKNNLTSRKMKGNRKKHKNEIDNIDRTPGRRNSEGLVWSPIKLFPPSNITGK